MATEIKMSASKREVKGKGDSNRMRHDGRIPGIVYGSGTDPVMIEINEHDFKQMLRKHASEHLLVDLKVDNDEQTVILKEVQHHPVTGRMLHADFQIISMTEKLTVKIPVVLVGEPVGVTMQGGVLEVQLRFVDIECLPANMPESIELDISKLYIGDHLTAGDIEYDSDKFIILTDSDYTVAAVAAPRVKEEDETVEEEEGEAVEGAEEGEGADAAPAEESAGA